MPQISPVGHWIKNIVDIAVIVLIVMAAKTAIAEPFYVPSGSMEPTLLIGDELLATKFPYGYSAASLPSFLVLPNTPRILGALPKRGDVVVFRWPGDRSQVWVKRVIGLPGDRIGIAQRPGLDQRHAQSVFSRPAPAKWKSKMAARCRPRASSRHCRADTNIRSSSWSPVPNRRHARRVVPPDHLFVMGDNRDNSADSRVPCARAASACCRWKIWSDAWTRSSVPGISA